MYQPKQLIKYGIGTSTIYTKASVRKNKHMCFKNRMATTIAQQIVQGEELAVLEDNNYVTMATPPSKASIPSFSFNKRDHTNSNHIFMRKLGGIEAMYNFYLSRGTELVSMMSRVESMYPIQEEAVVWALQCLMTRHKLLRSFIKYDQSSDERPPVFIEDKTLELDFLKLNRSDWLNLITEEVHKPFESSGKPLWRCRMLNAEHIKTGYTHTVDASKFILFGDKNDIISNNISDSQDIYPYQSIFVFIAHHSVMDGGYIMWLFQEFVNFMDAFVLRTPVGAVRSLPLLPPIEDCLKRPSHAQVICTKGTKGNWFGSSTCKVKLYAESRDCTALEDYNSTFIEEISILSNQAAKNDILYYKFSNSSSLNFMKACALNKCKPTGALIAATVLAMIDLIYPHKDTDESLEFHIPVEFLIDLRRHYGIQSISDELVPYYTGVATCDIPIVVYLKLSSRTIDRREFWNIASTLGNVLQQQVINPNCRIIDKLSEENFLNNPELKNDTGKSPFLLSFSNIGNLDNVLHESLRERVRLTDVHGHSSTLIDQMPVFFVSTIAVNGHLSCNVSYCKGYTSIETTLRYMNHLVRYIDQGLNSAKL